jgi:hypothetical protein
MSFAYLTGDVDTWWVELLHYVPYPAYLLPALVALALSFKLRWPWRIVATVTLLLVLTVIMGLTFGHGDQGTGHLRMMTYNIKALRASERENGFEQIATEVAMHNPDVLVMQDAGELSQRHYERPGLVMELFVGRYVYQHGQYIVLSRYPLRDCEAIPMTHVPAVRLCPLRGHRPGRGHRSLHRASAVAAPRTERDAPRTRRRHR